jgi:hypothetical protein
MEDIMGGESVQKEGGNKLFKRITTTLTGITAMVVVTGALFNAGLDLYKTVKDIPTSDSEVKNHDLRSNHFNESPLFQRDIEINRGEAKKVLRLFVYNNADIYVNYSGAEQWFSGNDSIENATNANYLLFIDSAIAQDARRVDIRQPAQPILQEEAQRVIINLDTIQSVQKKESKLRQDKIERTHMFSKANDSHSGFSKNTKSFSETYTAEPGYRIVGAELNIISINNARIITQSVSSNGDSFTIKAEVDSGPIYDQWRGWVQSQVIMKQIRK